MMICDNLEMRCFNGVNFMVPALQVQNIFCNIATNLGEGTQTCRINLETQ